MQLSVQRALLIGAATGWMNRRGYLLFMLVFAVVIPLSIVFSMSLLPRVSDKAINIPNRDYWLGPAQREATFGFLTAHACWLGSLMIVFITGIHFMLIAANATQPWASRRHPLSREPSCPRRGAGCRAAPPRG